MVEIFIISLGMLYGGIFFIINPMTTSYYMSTLLILYLHQGGISLVSIASNLSCFYMTLSYAHLEGVGGIRSPPPPLGKLLVNSLHLHSKFTGNMPRTPPLPPTHAHLNIPRTPPPSFGKIFKFLDPRKLISSLLR